MKKLFLLLCLLATTVIAGATDVWEGEQAISWENTLQIEAAQFAGMKVGDKLVVDFKDAAGEVIELHSNGGMLPGTRFAHFISPAQSNIEVFATPAMLACLQEYGMEICGMNFTATKVWYGDGKEGIDNLTAWSGFFWMDEWSTLEITKNSFEGIEWSNISSIRFCSEAGRTDYVINILTKWGDGGKLGDQTTMTMTSEYAELSLDGIDMEAALANTDRLMIQCNKEGGEPFNFTQVQLVAKPSAVKNVSAETEGAANDVYTVSGVKVNNIGQKGLYIVNGKKFAGK